MSLSTRRIRAITRKEVREYRRKKSVIVTTAVFPLIFLVQPLAIVFVAPSSSADTLGQFHLLLYMLAIPAMVPAYLAAYSVVGEREQGTLEPILTTPVGREEFLLGKALAALLPSVVIAYLVYVFFLACVALFAQAAVASAVVRPSDILAQVVFTPLLACWSIWVGTAISTRTGDARVAQQLGLLGSLPAVLMTSLIAFNVIPVSLGLGIGLGVLLLVLDGGGWRIVSALFDRERLVTGSGS